MSPYMPEGPKPKGTTSFRKVLAEGARRANTPKRSGGSHTSHEIQEITLKNWRHPWDSNFVYYSSKMVGPSKGGGPEVQDDREDTPPPLTKKQIEGHLFALRFIIKGHNMKNKTDPMLDFDDEDTMVKDTRIVKRKEVVDDDLINPFKEALKTPLTRRTIEFAGPEYKMSTNIKLYDGTTDPRDHLGHFASAANFASAYASLLITLWLHGLDAQPDMGYYLLRNQEYRGAYNITFEPRNVVKRKILTDFITETPDGESPEEYFRIPKVTPERDDIDNGRCSQTGHQVRRDPERA
uniref:Uncharacterized protein n=1 Tax=Tanacetum cinerariifolium TaxID=118510 RepID=A0A6L2NV06_TANCI|nr:hypothetical protein [Tanacetum cinerariifolium]